MKLSTITWLALAIIMAYYLTSLATAYHQAMSVYLDMRNHQAIEMLYGKR